MHLIFGALALSFTFSFALAKTTTERTAEGVVRAETLDTKGLVHPQLPVAPLLVAEAMVLLPANEKFQKTSVGGLSALSWTNENLLLLSDDRGKIADPRFYEAEFKFANGKAEVRITGVQILKDLPGLKDRTVVLDPEAMARLSDGSLVISSEADTNRKPREKNRLMHFSAKGVFQKEIPLPNELQAEPTGLQKKGTANNSGIEGLSLTPSGHFLWTAVERPLVQETNFRHLRFDRFKNDPKQGWRHEKQVTYVLDEAIEGSREVLRGVSAILALGDDQLLVIERSAVFMPAKVLGFGGGIYFADCRVNPCEKKPVLNFEMDLKKLRSDRSVANFEGLSWGPVMSDGRKTILLLSDNNFTRSDDTEIIVLSLKEKSP